MTRSLAEHESRVLEWMIRTGRHAEDDNASVTDADRTRWLARAPRVRVKGVCGCGTCPSIELVDPSGDAPDVPEDRIVLHADVVAPSTGADREPGYSAMLLLFIDDDRLSHLELAPLDDSAFEVFPEVDRLRAQF